MIIHLELKLYCLWRTRIQNQAKLTLPENNIFQFLVPQRSNNEKEEEDQIMFADAVDWRL